MLDVPNRDRRAERRSATQAEILEAAWSLCAANGLASLSLRDLARQIGLKAPSSYSYFESKNAINDAMFAQRCQQFLDWRPAHIPSDLLGGIRAIMGYFVSFCVADPVRYQLLFQRTIPGFEPSAESFAISQTAMRPTLDWFADHGLDRPEVVDLFTALGSGIAVQQNSNEPGDDWWARLVDDAAQMLVRHIRAGPRPAGTTGNGIYINTTTTAARAIRRVERPECTAQAVREFDRVGELLATLGEAEWSRPTECPD